MNIASEKNNETSCRDNTDKVISREMLRWCLWGMPLLAVAIGLFLLVVQHAHISEEIGRAHV